LSAKGYRVPKSFRTSVAKHYLTSIVSNPRRTFKDETVAIQSVGKLAYFLDEPLTENDLSPFIRGFIGQADLDAQGVSIFFHALSELGKYRVLTGSFELTLFHPLIADMPTLNKLKAQSGAMVSHGLGKLAKFKLLQGRVHLGLFLPIADLLLQEKDSNPVEPQHVSNFLYGLGEISGKQPEENMLTGSFPRLKLHQLLQRAITLGMKSAQEIAVSVLAVRKLARARLLTGSEKFPIASIKQLHSALLKSDPLDLIALTQMTTALRGLESDHFFERGLNDEIYEQLKAKILELQARGARSENPEFEKTALKVIEERLASSRASSSSPHGKFHHAPKGGEEAARQNKSKVVGRW
jgi:hypothetical protein